MISCRLRGVTPSGGVSDFNFLQHMADNGHIFCSNVVVYAPISTCNVPIDPASRHGLGMLTIAKIGSYLVELREFEEFDGSVEVHVPLG